MAESSCELECIATTEVTKADTWLKSFIVYLGVIPSIIEPVEIFYDNGVAITLTKEPKDHRNSRHILRKYHYV